jgi:hypothetical protein
MADRKSKEDSAEDEEAENPDLKGAQFGSYKMSEESEKRITDEIESIK